MSAFLDSSVLIAAFYGHHVHHKPSLALLAKQTPRTGATAAHCLAETYSVLTGMPGKERVTPEEALLFLSSVRERLRLITLTEKEYVLAIEHSATTAITGGTVYDALIIACADKVKAKTVYSWNLKHFTRLAELVKLQVKSPS